MAMFEAGTELRGNDIAAVPDETPLAHASEDAS
jgi:hypothetical protein